MQMNSESYLKTQPVDKDGIQKLLNDFVCGWNAHDAKLFSKAFAEDADFTNVMGVSKNGRTAIEEMHDPLFKTIWATSTLTITKSTTRFIKPDVVAVDARWDLDGLKNADGSDRPSRNGLLSFIMIKQDNQWLIIVMHNMDLPGSGSQKC
jgi:uncharacterized protein (TIGR02246 family)